MTKLDRIVHGLRYLRLRVAGEEDAGLAHRCNIMQERLKQWKATIRPAKKLQQQFRKGDEGAGNVKNAVALVRCKELWCAVRDVLSKAATGDHPSAKESKLVLAAIMARLVYRSWQRPGAVSNATMDEFAATSREADGEAGEPCWVMLISRHKMARQGPASITMTQENYRLLRQYVKHIRPLSHPAVDNTFVGANGLPIQKLNDLIQWLGTEYEVETPTCTKLRATATALKCDDAIRHLISSQMTHTQQIHSQHYELLQGRRKLHVLTRFGKSWLTVIVTVNLPGRIYPQRNRQKQSQGFPTC